MDYLETQEIFKGFKRLRISGTLSNLQEARFVHSSTSDTASERMR